MRKIGIIIILVLCLTLLLLTGCVVNTVIPETASGNLENQEDIYQSTNNSQNSSTGPIYESATEVPVIEEPAEEPVMWSGLGMGLWSAQESDIDTLLANGFKELRIDIPDYQYTAWLNASKARVIMAIAKGVKVIWGVSSNSYNNKDYTITAKNWFTFRQAILDNAQWAQDNGVFEFQLGNEEEYHVDGTTMTVAQIMINLRAVATDVQAIFTRGNVSYACAHDQEAQEAWNTLGLGDIDLISFNTYVGTSSDWDWWKSKIDWMVSYFGARAYLTEFNLSPTSLDDYSTDETVQATALTEMIDYIKASGMTRAFYFIWKDDEESDFGAVKYDGTYRLLWNQALLNTGPVESTTVPIKTTTISLPDTIALIPK